MSKSEIEAKIEYEELIGEAKPGGYQPVRFTRVKYKASPTPHIDIRRFQRAPGDEDEYQFFPTKVGFRFPEREFRRVVGRYALMPDSYVHPTIIKKSFELLQNEEYESAVLQAFKAVEVTVREKIGASADIFGERLLKKAFNPDDGVLTNFELPKAERFAFLNYLTGAFSFYRNASSHRDVELDFISAFKKIVVASELMMAVEDAKLNA